MGNETSIALDFLVQCQVYKTARQKSPDSAFIQIRNAILSSAQNVYCSENEVQFFAVISQATHFKCFTLINMTVRDRKKARVNDKLYGEKLQDFSTLVVDRYHTLVFGKVRAGPEGLGSSTLTTFGV